MVLNRVALTGASGSLGRHLLATLAHAGIAVAAASRRRPADLAPGQTWHPLDLNEWQDLAALDRAFPDVEALLHAGAAVPAPGRALGRRELLDCNLRASLALFEWALDRGIPLVFISGAAVYAEAEGGRLTEASATTRRGIAGFYGLTKLLAEELIESLRGEGLEAAVLRPSSIYGAGMDAAKMIPRFLATAAAGETIELAPPIEDRVDLVHAGDVARLALAALRQQARGSYNVGGEGPVSVVELAEACVEVAGAGRVAVLPGEAPRPPVTRFDLDCGRARAELGYRPRIALKQGLRLMLEGRCDDGAQDEDLTADGAR